MARFLSLIRTSVAETAADWDRFWFTPTDSSTLGLIRMAAGGMLVYTHAVWGLELDAFFSDQGWQDPQLVAAIAPGSGSWSFWWIVPDAWKFPVHCLSVLMLLCYLLGLGARWSAPMAAAITVSYAHRVPQATFGLDQINTLLTIYLALAYACLPRQDSALSLDRWLALRSARRKARNQDLNLPVRPHAAVCMATRLIQIHLSIIYLYSGLSKLKGETWWDGTAVWLAAANLEYQSGDLTWLAWTPAFINLATVGTVAFEMLFPILIWNRRFRPGFIVAGLLLHFGIGKFLGMWTFGIAMQICYLSFLPPQAVQTLWKRRFLRPTSAAQ